ncbi:MAG: LPS export ABC transporter periplasmic protein LptC [Spirochaetes bacterium]|nr:LPS export ABC transporter periplasmic protein LptC [Spirochaetota bacterium]
MEKKTKPIIWILLFLLFLQCKTKQSDDSEEPRKILPDIIQQNYMHYIYKNKRIYLEAEIELAEFFDESNKIECKVFTGTTYNSKGKMNTQIWSDQAVIDSAGGSIQFNGNVIVNMIDKKVKLYTDELFFNYKDNILIGERGVIFEKEDGSKLNADKMVSNFADDQTEFTNMDLKYFYKQDSKDSTGDENEE